MTDISTVVHIGDEYLPVRPDAFDPSRPTVLLPIVITWGQETPWSEHNATTIDLTMKASKPGWKTMDRLIGERLEIERRGPISRATTVATFIITDVTLTDDGNAVRYHVKGSTYETMMARDTRKPITLNAGYVGRDYAHVPLRGYLEDYTGYHGTAAGLVDYTEYAAPSGMVTSAFSGYPMPATTRLEDHHIADATNMLDLMQGWHVYRPDSLDGVPGVKWYASTWCLQFMPHMGYMTGVNDRSVIVWMKDGSISSPKGWYFSYYNNGYLDWLNAKDIRIESDELTMPDTYSAVTFKTWDVDPDTGEWKQSRQTTIDIPNERHPDFPNVLTLDCKDFAHPGTNTFTYRNTVYQNGGGTTPQTATEEVDVTNVIREMTEQNTRPRLPTITLKPNISPFAAKPGKRVVVIGSKFEHTHPETHGQWVYINGTSTLTKTKTGEILWEISANLWPLAGVTTSPTIAEYRTAPATAKTFRNQEKLIGFIRYVNEFEKEGTA